MFSVIEPRVLMYMISRAITADILSTSKPTDFSGCFLK